VDGIALDPPTSPGTQVPALIGRDAQRREVLGAFERSQAEGTHTYLISGEPGVGKSALVRALASDLIDREHLWLEFHCSELASASPLRPVISGLRDLLEIRDHDTPQEQLAKLTTGLDDQGAATATLLPYLADLLAIDRPEQSGLEGLSGELRRARTLEALLEWAVAAASHGPLVVVAEDLQWADPTTLELLQRIQVRGGNRPILLLCTSRLDAAHGMFADTDHLRLGRLSVADSRALAVRLGEIYDVPQDTLVKLADRGDGIPLFVEELVRGAAESPTGAERPRAALPDTLQSLLAARLDRLGEARSVAQAAAVIGREFSLDLLSVVTQVTAESLRRSLQELEEAGIVTPPAATGEGNYVFRHALIQDAAYASLLRRSRRELHATIASLLPDMRPMVATTAPELVAHHYEAAGASLMAARWYADAGRRACERAAFMEAISHFDSGIGLLENTDLTSEGERLLLSLLILSANAHMGTSGPGGESTLPLWEQAIALAEELGDTDELTSALNGLATYQFDRGQLEATIELATKILELSQSSGSRVAALRGNLSLAMARFYRGEAVLALSHCEEGLKLERDGDYFTVTYGIGHDQGTMGRSVLAWSQWWLGRPDAALATAREGLRRAEDLPSSLSQAMARHMVGFIHYERGDSDEALAAARANVSATEELNFAFWLGTSLLVRGAQTSRLGDETGLHDLDRAFDLLIDGSNRGGGSMAFSLFAQAQQALGLNEQAIATAELGLAITDGNGQPFYDPELRRIAAMSRYTLDPDCLGEVVGQLSGALGLARRLGAASFALRIATDLATLPGSEGNRRTQAIGELEVALAQMGDGHDTADQISARGRLDVLDPTRSVSAHGPARRRHR
jgi:tetratricopeptide (TPR) repeat protein